MEKRENVRGGRWRLPDQSRSALISNNQRSFNHKFPEILILGNFDNLLKMKKMKRISYESCATSSYKREKERGDVMYEY